MLYIKEKTVVLLLLLLITPAFCFAAEPATSPWQLSMSMSHIDWSTGDVDNSGNQTLGFTNLSYKQANWDVSATGTFARTSYSTELSDDSYSVSALTDTIVSSHYSIERWNIKFTGGVDLNLPTGKQSFSIEDIAKIITDSISEDLMVINSYGSGLNVTPHLMAVYNFENATLGAGIRYEITGEYDPTTDMPNDNIDPGERFLLIVNGALKLRGNDYVVGTLSYDRSSPDKQEGQEIFNIGNTYGLSLRYIHQWDEGFTSIASLSVKTQDENRILSEGNVLNSENNNSNNNSWELFVNNVYSYSKEFSFLGMVGYKDVAANGYDQGETLYDAGRTKIYIEPGVQWFRSKDMYVTGQLKYSYLSDKKDVFSSTDATYNVISATIGFVYVF